MTAGYWGSTNMAFRPGVAFKMNADIPAATASPRLLAIYTQSHIDYWTDQGIFCNYVTTHNWRGFYTDIAVKPSDPTDHTDPGYNWSMLDGLMNMPVFSMIGPGMIFRLMHAGSAGRYPLWFINAGYTWTNSNGSVQTRWDLSAARQELKDFFTAFYNRYKNNRQFWSIVLEETLNASSSAWPSGYSSVTSGVGMADLLNTICLQWNREIAVIQTTPFDNLITNLLPEIGYYTPDLKMFQSGCTPVCSVGTNRAIIQSAFENRILMQGTELNGMNPLVWPDGIDNPFGYSSSTPSHVPSAQESIWYAANIVKNHVLVWSPNDWQNAASTLTLGNIYQANDTFMYGGTQEFPPLPSNYDTGLPSGGGSTAADVVVKDVQYTANTGTGSANTAHGQASTPKHVTKILTGATALDTSANILRLSYGATDVTTQGAVSYKANNGVTPSNTAKIGKTTNISLQQPGGASTIDGEALFSSVDGTNVAINTTNGYGSAFLGILTTVAGDDANCKVINGTLGNSGTTLDLSIGFVPTHIKVTSIHRSNNGTSESGATFSHGAASNDSGISQWCFARNDPNGAAAPAGVASAQLRNDCIVAKLDSAGAITWSASVTTWGSTITLTVANGNANSDILVEAFKFDNCRVVCSIIDSPTTSNVTVPDTYPISFPVGKIDRAELLVTQLTSVNAASTTGPAGEYGWSLIDLVADTSFTLWFRSRIGQTNTQTSSFIENEAFDYSLHDASGTPFLAGTVSSNLDSDITIAWTTVPATAVKMGAISYQFSTDAVSTPPTLHGTSVPTGTAQSQTEIQWAWNDATNADGYLLYWSTDNSIYIFLADVTQADKTADSGYLQSGLPANTTIYMKYLAYNAAGQTGYSTTGSEMTDSPSDTSAPTYGGITSASYDPVTGNITITHTQGTDNVTAQASLKYYVVAFLGADTVDFDAYIDGPFTDTNTIVLNDPSFWVPGTWYIGLVCVDEAGNQSTNTSTESITIGNLGIGTIGPCDNGSGSAKTGMCYLFYALNDTIMPEIDMLNPDRSGEQITLDANGEYELIATVGDYQWILIDDSQYIISGDPDHLWMASGSVTIS